MKNLLIELDEIRKTEEFIKYGFADGGNHKGFIDKCKRLSKSGNRHISENAKRMVYIAYAYVTSRGEDTNNIRKQRKTIS